MYIIINQDKKVDIKGDLKGVYIMNKHFWSSICLQSCKLSVRWAKQNFTSNHYPLLGNVTWSIIFVENNSKIVIKYIIEESPLLNFATQIVPKKHFFLFSPLKAK